LKSVFIRNVASVLTGSIMAQAVPIVGALVLARQYAPAEFGAYSAWLGVVLFMSVVVTARLEACLAIEPDGQPRKDAVVSTLYTIVVMSLLPLVIVAILLLVRLDYFERFSGVLIWLFVPAASLVAAVQTYQAWAAAEGMYRRLSLMRISQAVSVTGLQVAAGELVPTSLGLGAAYCFGLAVALAAAVTLMPLGRIRWVQLITNAKALWYRQRNFPKFSLPADAMSVAAAQLPIVIVAARFGADSAGLLAMAMRMMGAPITILAFAVLDVFKRHSADAFRTRGECRAEYVRTFKFLTGVAVVLSVVLSFGVEFLFGVAFGELWIGAGAMALWLLPRYMMGFVASPLSYIVYVSQKQHIDLLWQLALFGVTMATFMLLQPLGMAVKAYSLGAAALYVVYLGFSYRLSKGQLL